MAFPDGLPKKPDWHDLVLVDVAAATMAQPTAAAGPGYGLIEDAAVAVRDGVLSYVGPRAGLPGGAARVIEGRGGLVTPGLIDCHTHLVYGGSRAREFEQRLDGATYEEIARAGGGIVSTVRATRALDEEALVAAALPRLDALLSRRRHHRRNQVGLRPDHRERTPPAARGPPPGGGAASGDTHHVPRRPRDAAGARDADAYIRPGVRAR